MKMTSLNEAVFAVIANQHLNEAKKKNVSTNKESVDPKTLSPKEHAELLMRHSKVHPVYFHLAGNKDSDPETHQDTLAVDHAASLGGGASHAIHIDVGKVLHALHNPEAAANKGYDHDLHHFHVLHHLLHLRHGGDPDSQYKSGSVISDHLNGHRVITLSPHDKEHDHDTHTGGPSSHLGTLTTDAASGPDGHSLGAYLDAEDHKKAVGGFRQRISPFEGSSGQNTQAIAKARGHMPHATCSSLSCKRPASIKRRS